VVVFCAIEYSTEDVGYRALVCMGKPLRPAAPSTLGLPQSPRPSRSENRGPLLEAVLTIAIWSGTARPVLAMRSRIRPTFPGQRLKFCLPRTSFDGSLHRFSRIRGVSSGAHSCIPTSSRLRGLINTKPKQTHIRARDFGRSVDGALLREAVWLRYSNKDTCFC